MPLRRRKQGRGFMDFLKKAYNVGKNIVSTVKSIKPTQYLQGLKNTKYGNIIGMAENLGFGRRRRYRRRRN